MEKTVFLCLVIHKECLWNEWRRVGRSQVKRMKTSISFTDTVMGLHSQWLRNTGVGFQTSQTPSIQQHTAVVARYKIIHKNYHSMAKIRVTKNIFCRRPSKIQKWVSDNLHIKCTNLECKCGECHVTKIRQTVQPLQPKDCAVQVDVSHWIVQNYYFMLDTNIPEMLEYFI